MITDTDIQKLISILATKDDIREIKEDFLGMREAIQSLTIPIDRMTKSIEILSQEYASIKVQLDRHEEWIKQIAEKTRVHLQ